MSFYQQALLHEQGVDLAETFALELQKTRAPKQFAGGTWGGDSVACTRAQRDCFPLGETCNWGMKAFLQRDYIGVQRSEWCGRK
jgi:hypothetical protein